MKPIIPTLLLVVSSAAHAGLDRAGNVLTSDEESAFTIQSMVLMGLFFWGIYKFTEKVLSWSSTACFYSSLIGSALLAVLSTKI
ncbi:hypothetical protein [Polaromonas glacialis]|uniref:hypothetical protein n=1 Tax=Polaromonas glacialis TaxID=866564 RepID=UPI0004969E67|nr:hypothetical protein [Polaromonas glacialis]